jgi:hypothetical protein
VRLGCWRYATGDDGAPACNRPRGRDARCWAHRPRTRKPRLPSSRYPLSSAGTAVCCCP